MPLSGDDFIFGVQAASTGSPLRDGEGVGHRLGLVAPVWNWAVPSWLGCPSGVGRGGSNTSQSRAGAGMTPVLSLCRAAVGEPGGWRGGGNQRGAERAPGPQRRLPVPGQDRAEPGPDESKRHQRDHEH